MMGTALLGTFCGRADVCNKSNMHQIKCFYNIPIHSDEILRLPIQL